MICVRQHDDADCGAAVLATVARHYGRKISVERLRDLSGTDRNGTNLLGLEQAAQEAGFEARAVKGDYDALRELPLPVIAHVRVERGGHFVVVHKIARTLTIADPAAGVVKWTPEEFRERWSGHLLVVLPGEAREESRRPRLLGLMARHRGTILEALCCAFWMTLLGLGLSLFVQQILDTVLVRSDRGLLNVLGVGMLLVVAFGAAFGAMRQYLLVHLSRKIDLALLRRYLGHILRLPVSFFESRKVGDILSRLNDNARIRQLIGSTGISVILDAVFVLGAGALMLALSPSMALVALVLVPALLAAIGLHVRPLQRSQRKVMEEGAELQGRLVEDVTGIETIKAAGVEADRLARTEESMLRFSRHFARSGALSASMGTATMFLSGLGALVVLWVGAHRVMDGALTIGQLMLFSSLMGLILAPVQRLIGMVAELQDATIALDRLGEVLELPAERAGGEPFRGLRRGIRLEGVSFRYGCRDLVLRDVDLEIPAGTTVAVVGESGCGKSTLCKLLAGFHAPTSGRILLDGIDVRDLDLESLRKSIGWVQQEPFIFGGTVRENIALGRPDATLEEIMEAARLAQLDEFIEGLPDRYDARIGERGANLSGGQRQRLAIARAILGRPEILIFDEATSHLDTATERAMQESLAGVLADRTAILIAHRLSTIRRADLIVVMDGGRIVEAGTHEELLAREGRYSQLQEAA